MLTLWEKNVDRAIAGNLPSQALALLYVANELLQAHRSDATWHRVFSRTLPSVFPRVCTCAGSSPSDCKARVLGLAAVWRDREVFSVSFCDGLLERCKPQELPNGRLQEHSPPPPDYEPECSPSPAPSADEQDTGGVHGMGGWLGLFSTTDGAGMMALSLQRLAAGTPPPFLAAKRPTAAHVKASISAALADAARAPEAAHADWILVHGELLATALEAKARCERGLADAAKGMEERTSRECQHRLVLAISGAEDLDDVTRNNEDDEHRCASAVSFLQSACRARWTEDMALWRQGMDSALQAVAAADPRTGGRRGAGLHLSLVHLKHACAQLVTCPAFAPAEDFARGAQAAMASNAIGAAAVAPVPVAPVHYTDDQLLSMFTEALLQHQQASSSQAPPPPRPPYPPQQRPPSLLPPPPLHVDRTNEMLLSMLQDVHGGSRGQASSSASSRGSWGASVARVSQVAPHVTSSSAPHVTSSSVARVSQVAPPGAAHGPAPSHMAASPPLDPRPCPPARDRMRHDTPPNPPPACAAASSQASAGLGAQDFGGGARTEVPRGGSGGGVVRTDGREVGGMSRRGDKDKESWEEEASFKQGAFREQRTEEASVKQGAFRERSLLSETAACCTQVEQEDLIVERQQLSLLCPLSCKRSPCE